MTQISELLNLALALALGPIIVLSARSVPRRRTDSAIGLGVGFIVLAYAVTVLEGLLLPDLLDAVEHMLYAAAGLTFLWALWIRSRPSKDRS